MGKDLFWRSKGFTLIELLVVIAIIGLLVSISAAAINDARTRSKDNTIKADLSQIRSEATIIQTESDSYVAADNSLCDGDNNSLNEGNLSHAILGDLEEAVEKLNGNQKVNCYADTGAYCVSSPLPGGETYCVDSTGYAGTEKSFCGDSDKCNSLIM